MAADDDDRKPEPDPWADIVADGIDGDEASSFQFDAEPAAVSPPDDIPPVADESTAAAASDELVDAWLAEDDDASSTAGEHAPLAVFAPEDAASGSSSIDIGTGLSGIDGDSSRGAVEESSEIAADAWGEEPVDAAGDAGEALTIDGGDAVEAESVEFPGVSIAAAAATAAPLTTGTRRPAAAKKPAGGIGQMIGVALGGLAAIPITLGILIWGLQKDPFGVTKSVPSSVSFLRFPGPSPMHRRSTTCQRRRSRRLTSPPRTWPRPPRANPRPERRPRSPRPPASRHSATSR